MTSSTLRLFCSRDMHIGSRSSALVVIHSRTCKAAAGVGAEWGWEGNSRSRSEGRGGIQAGLGEGGSHSRVLVVIHLWNSAHQQAL